MVDGGTEDAGLSEAERVNSRGSTGFCGYIEDTGLAEILGSKNFSNTYQNSKIIMLENTGRKCRPGIHFVDPPTK